MQKCAIHNKTAVGNCTWCGRLICNACVGKVNRNKVYCSKCSSELSPIINKMQMDQIHREKEEEMKEHKRKFFDFDSIVSK